MNPNLLTSICRDLLTSDDSATASTLQAGLESLATQLRIYNPAHLGDIADRAGIAYAENPTLDYLKAYEDALVLQHIRRNVTRPAVGAVETALARFHAARVVPWQLAIVHRILPAARLLREKLVAEENARSLELIGRTMGTSDVIVEADLIVRRLEELLKSLPTGSVTPRDFLRHLHAAPGGETSGEDAAATDSVAAESSIPAMPAVVVDAPAVEEDDGPALAR